MGLASLEVDRSMFARKRESWGQMGRSSEQFMFDTKEQENVNSGKLCSSVGTPEKYS